MAERLILALMVICTAAVARVTGDCGRPPTLENGSLLDAFISETSFTIGSRVTYRCLPGYIFKPGGSSSSTCRTDSTWTPLRATCGPRNCGNPGEIANGYYKATSSTFGSKAYFYCDTGYRIVGRPFRLCVSTGWDGQVPTCDIVTCDDLPPISNGRTPTPVYQPNWEYGMVAEYSCNAEFSLIGPRELTCTATGKWDQNPPICKVVRCYRPAMPENGRIVAGFGPTYMYRDTISFSCNDGFEIVGSSIITCGEHSIFVPPAPTCRNQSEPTLAPTPAPTPTNETGGVAGTFVGQQYGPLIILNVTVFLMIFWLSAEQLN